MDFKETGAFQDKAFGLVRKKEAILNACKTDEDHQKLVDAFQEFNKLLTEFCGVIMALPMIPTKPMDPYAKGGIANGLAGPVAGAFTIIEQEQKIQKYKEDLANAKEQHSRANVEFIKIKREYDSLVYLIENTPGASEIYTKKCAPEIQRSIVAKEKAKKSNINFTNIFIVSVILYLFYFFGSLVVYPTDPMGTMFMALLPFMILIDILLMIHVIKKLKDKRKFSKATIAQSIFIYVLVFLIISALQFVMNSHEKELKRMKEQQRMREYNSYHISKLDELTDVIFSEDTERSI